MLLDSISSCHKIDPHEKPSCEISEISIVQRQRGAAVTRLTIALSILAGLIAVVLLVLVYEGSWTKMYQAREGFQIWENRLTGKQLLCDPAWSPRCHVESEESKHPSPR